MWKVRQVAAFIFVVTLTDVRCDVRNIVMMTGNGSRVFSDLWTSVSPVNDPNGNKSLDSTLPTNDFMVPPDPAWGTATSITFGFYNEVGNEIGRFDFDVTGHNITDLSSWMVPANLINSFPETSYTGVSCAIDISAGSHEAVISKADTGTVLMAIVHSTTDPILLLPVNSTDYIHVNSGGSPTGDGCWAYIDLNLTLASNGSSDLSVESCFAACPGSTSVALQTGDTCYCAFIKSSVHGSLPAYCTLPCPGNTAQLCGGPNSGYYSVYSGAAPLPTGSVTLDTVTYPSQGDVLLTTYHANWTNDTPMLLNIATEIGINYLYVWKLSVNAVTDMGQDVSFSLDYHEHGSQNYSRYNDYFIPQLTLISNGTWIDLGIMLFSDIQLNFSDNVVNVTVKLYGPTEYVSAPYLRVFGIFVPPTTSTTSTLSTPTTTSYPEIITVPYTYYQNESIWYNGTMYCPCNGTTTNSTNTTDIDVIIAEMTLDEDTLSSNTRKYISADDSRPSAKTLGSIGVIIIAVVLGGIVALDSATLALELSKLGKNCQFLKRQMSKKSTKVGDESKKPEKPDGESVTDVEMTDVSRQTSVTTLSDDIDESPQQN